MDEFEKLLNARNSVDLLLTRIFNPKKYPEFHEYLDKIHEAWISSYNPCNRM